MVSNNNEDPFKPEDDSNEMPSDSEYPEDIVEIPPEPIKLDFKTILEKELGLIKVFDYVRANPFDLMFQSKLIDKYQTDLIYPLIGKDVEPHDVDGGRAFLREEYYQMNIEEKARSVLSESENIARANGIKTTLQKQMGTWNIALMVIVMGAYFTLATVFPSVNTMYIMIPVFAVLCFAPNLLRNYFTKRWNTFKGAHAQEVFQNQADNLEDIKIWVQDLINDARDRLLENKVELSKIQFGMLSDDYENVIFVRSQGGMRGVPLSNIYQFEYPEGMKPATPANYGSSGIPEDDNDLFVYLKGVGFDEDGSLGNFTSFYPMKAQYRLPEALLSASEFTAVSDPRLVIPSFNNNKKILCECGEPVRFSEMKTCISNLHNNYEFYLVIGEKCKKCFQNPFVLFNSPGNEKIPEGLQSIFE